MGKGHSDNSFYRDGLSVKEFLLVLTAVFTLLVFAMNSFFIFKIIKLVNDGNIKELLPSVLDFMKAMTAFYIIPYMIIVCFYFLSDRTANLISNVVASKAININTSKPQPNPPTEVPIDSVNNGSIIS